MKKEKTYKITKIYRQGHQWTDKIVSFDALKRYIGRISTLLDEEESKLTAVTISCAGISEEDVERKEYINDRTFSQLDEKAKPDKRCFEDEYTVIR